MDAKAAHIPLSTESVSEFRSPAEFLRDLDHGTIAELVSVAADIAMVVENGIVKDVALGGKTLVDEGYGKAWPGMAWIDTVTIESRPKIEDILNQRLGSRRGGKSIMHPNLRLMSQSSIQLLRLAKVIGSSRSAVISAEWRFCNNA